MASAANGRVALDMLRAEAFDLLLLDMEVPELDGFQVLEQMVGDARLQFPRRCGPCSALHRAGRRRLSAQAGEPRVAQARINSSLEKKRLRDQHELIKRFATSEVVDDLTDIEDPSGSFDEVRGSPGPD